MKNIALSLCMALAAGVRSHAAENSTSLSVLPQTVQEVGRTAAHYGPTRWPIFGPSQSDNEACANNLRANFSGKPRSATNPGKYPPATPQTVLSKTVSFSGVGLDAYRRTATVVVTWTLRAEAYISVVNPWTEGLCSPWHSAFFIQDFPGGELQTMLHVNGVQRGNVFSMTFPPLGRGVSTNASDPTITGSVVLTPAMFGGEFPDTLRYEVKWINDTIGARAESPAYMRNMTILITPVGNNG